MQVDGYKFLPRSFRSRFEVSPAPGDGDEVFAPFGPRLAGARVALLSSAGLYLKATQEPFDEAGEKANPLWGDPGWRAVPRETAQGELGLMHLHINGADILADHEVALPLRALDALVDAGVVGSSAPTHYSVMGYQEEGLRAWRDETAPAIVESLRDERVDGLILAPA
ncbi:MAG TPA: hypothetical protein VE990_06390 [Acidimicrobiales bacterium]|nr:hypothetical protein [Acidimicrobiales bacterium]